MANMDIVEENIGAGCVGSCVLFIIIGAFFSMLPIVLIAIFIPILFPIVWETIKLGIVSFFPLLYGLRWINRKDTPTYMSLEERFSRWLGCEPANDPLVAAMISFGLILMIELPICAVVYFFL